VNKIFQEFYFDIEEVDKVVDKKLLNRLRKRKYKSGIKSRKWFSEWMKK